MIKGGKIGFDVNSIEKYSKKNKITSIILKLKNSIIWRSEN